MRPKESEHPKYYNYYIDLITQEDVLNALTESKKTTLDFIDTIPIELANYAYADLKWTVKQVLIHCVDTERIFATRALGFARGDSQKPNSYDENSYAVNSHANLRSITDISEEFEAVRNSTILLFKSFSFETLMAKGDTPSGFATVNSVGFTICGHTNHHLNIIKERYLKK
ncbi:MAG: DinB family protein [Bacteroidota bacterium]|nr:DinB family protein [Bacteroidota bacterium]MDP3144984.1 DinB family protein [Bacteroidota bacterium]